MLSPSQPLYFFAVASSVDVVAPLDAARLDAWTEPCRACEWGVRELEDAVADPRNEKLAVCCPCIAGA